MSFIPYAVSWNITSRCNLNCKHCYIDANGRDTGEEGELTTAQALTLVDQIAELNPGAVLILTGGEPLLREDIYKIISHASSKGLMVVLGDNGVLLNSDVAGKLKEAGLSGVGISIDSLDPEKHDTFRGRPGALAAAMNGVVVARDAGIAVQIQTTPTKDNIREIPIIAEWANRMGAKVFNLFFLVCTGRGETMADISPDQYEDILKWAAEEKNSFPGMMVRPKCAPHFKRLLHQENPDNPLLSTYIAACRAGTHYCRVKPDGKVTACPYMEIEAGNILQNDFNEIWNNSEQLTKYRVAEYNGKCGDCRYRLLCGGCRARAYATVGDDMGEDQWCSYEPVGHEDAIENIDAQSKFGFENSKNGNWSEEAKAVLDKIPVFARPIVQLAVEKYADENNLEEITPEAIRSAAPSPRMFSDAPKDMDKEAAEKTPWDEDALARVSAAPDFVRPGILKLMQKRAKERGKSRIDTEFLSEIRDESMMLASRRMKKLGFDQLGMGAWGAAKEKFKKSERKQEVIDKIASFLNVRENKNEKIIEKFESFFSDDVGEKMGWTEEARDRMKKAPAFVREMATSAIESYARKNGYKYVTKEAIDKAMENLPFSKMGG